MKQGKSPGIPEIKQVLQTNRGNSFDIEEISPNRFCLSTRDNGSVGDETPGEADIAKARELAKIFRKEFPEVKATVETVDEWTHLDLEFPNEILAEIPDLTKRIKDAAIKSASVMLGENEANYLLTKENPCVVTQKGHNDEISQRSMAFNILSETIWAAYCKHDPKRLDSWTILSCQWGISQSESEIKATVQINHVTKTRVCENTQEIEQVLQSLTKETLKEFENHREYKKAPDLWKKTRVEEMPKLQALVLQGTLVGHAGYDGSIWENTQFIKLPDGNYAYVDNEDPESPQIWEIPQGAFVQAAKHLTEDFYPILPENSKSLREVCYEITQKIQEKIFEEALLGETKTLQAYGAQGTIFKAEDDSLHLTAPIGA